MDYLVDGAKHWGPGILALTKGVHAGGLYSWALARKGWRSGLPGLAGGKVCG